MFSLNNLKTNLNAAISEADVLKAFMDARAYGFGDQVFVTEAGQGVTYPANRVMFETTRYASGLNERLVPMFTVVGTVGETEYTYLGFNPYSGNETDMVNTMARQFNGKAAGTIVAQALGYDDYVVMQKVHLFSDPVVVGVQGSTLSSVDVWFSSFIVDEFPGDHLVTSAAQQAANANHYDTRMFGWDESGNNHICMDFAVRSTDDQNVVDLIGVIQNAAIQTLGTKVSSSDLDTAMATKATTAALAAESTRATTAEQSLARAFETTMAFGPLMGEAANAVLAVRSATGYIPRP